ncbi:CBS domain-containing protein [Nonomuraea aurantiaca]|uniref:CBS domain-containing protein n=1 Tax=Nonomuraea aurantiaca TaxID=2878562 RepID=UPI001CD973DE|nr:CBS domain-containing protein [Nonomuraea aurantiaca]MCA2229222.1 hypothetical protein [Nonomuraea aurantiaca]
MPIATGSGTCLPVVNGRGRLTGVVSRHDLVKVFARLDEDIVTLDERTRTRSDASLIARSLIRVNGVVDVQDKLLWDEDDL